MIHFDKERGLAEFDAVTALIEKELLRQIPDQPDQIRMQIGLRAVERAFVDWFVTSKMFEDDHEKVAHYAGTACGAMMRHLVDNYRCGCVAHRFQYAMLEQFKASAGSGLDVPGAETTVLPGMRGGRA